MSGKHNIYNAGYTCSDKVTNNMTMQTIGSLYNHFTSFEKREILIIIILYIGGS